MLSLRLPITLVLLVVYTIGIAAMGGMPRIYCEGTDGHTCIETVGNRCCQDVHQSQVATSHLDHEGSALPGVGESSCGQCTDNQVPHDDHQQVPSQQGKDKCFAVASVPVCVICPPADLLRVLDTRPFAAPVFSTAGRSTILRC